MSRSLEHPQPKRKRREQTRGALKLQTQLVSNDDRGRDRPNRAHCASDGRLHPTNGGSGSSNARAPHAIHGASALPVRCSSRDARWLREVCGRPWRCAADNRQPSRAAHLRTPTNPPSPPRPTQPSQRSPCSVSATYSSNPPESSPWLGWALPSLKHRGTANLSTPP